MDNTAKIKQLREELERLETQQAQYNRLDPAQKLADLIHDKFCRSNHIDQCGYEYDTWQSPSWTRLHYLDKANTILSLTDLKTAQAIIRAL